MKKSAFSCVFGVMACSAIFVGCVSVPRPLGSSFSRLSHIVRSVSVDSGQSRFCNMLIGHAYVTHCNESGYSEFARVLRTPGMSIARVNQVTEGASTADYVVLLTAPATNYCSNVHIASLQFHCRRGADYCLISRIDSLDEYCLDEGLPSDSSGSSGGESRSSPTMAPESGDEFGAESGGGG